MSVYLERQEVKKEARRQKGFFKIVQATQRISVVVLIWLLGLAAFYGLYLIIFEEPYFEVREIDVKGELRQLTPEIVVNLAGVKKDSNLFSLSIAETKKRILNNKWVKDLAVRRGFPDKLEVYVKEHRPVAIVNLDRLYFVNEEGILFKEVEAGDPKDYPVFTGVEMKAGETAQIKVFLDLKRFYEAGQTANLLGISEIHYDPRIGYSLVTYQPALVIRFGYDDFQNKLSKLEALLPVIQLQASRIEYVDVNYERKVIVKYGA